MSITREHIDNPTVSFESLIKEGIIKRGNRGMHIALKNIFILPGFNKRFKNAGLDEHVLDIVSHLDAGGEVPQLEVWPVPGGVAVADGHCRQAAFEKLGDPERRVEIKPFKGTYLDGLARIETSQENRKLSPLEKMELYKDMIAEGATLDDIASKVNKSRQRIEQIMKLADADPATRAMLEAGEVPTNLAVQAIRKHGDGAGEVLATQLAEAKAAGKKKLTEGAIQPTVGKPLLDDMYAIVGDWHKNIHPVEAQAVEAYLKGDKNAGHGKVEITVADFARLTALNNEAERQLDEKKRKVEERKNRAKQQEITA